jgi:hypothetical protein
MYCSSKARPGALENKTLGLFEFFTHKQPYAFHPQPLSFFQVLCGGTNSIPICLMQVMDQIGVVEEASISPDPLGGTHASNKKS